MTDLLALQGGNDPLTLFVALLGEQPSGRLGQHQETEDDKKTEEDLESDGESPSEVGGTVGGAEIHPVGDQGSNSNGTTLDTDEQTTIGGPRTFSLVCGDGRRVHAVSDTGNNTSNTELGQGNVSRDRRNLDDNTDDHDGGTQHDGVSAAEPVTTGEDEERTAETS